MREVLKARKFDYKLFPEIINLLFEKKKLGSQSKKKKIRLPRRYTYFVSQEQNFISKYTL